jgi:hypothetical protein
MGDEKQPERFGSVLAIVSGSGTILGGALAAGNQHGVIGAMLIMLGAAMIIAAIMGKM